MRTWGMVIACAALVAACSKKNKVDSEPEPVATPVVEDAALPADALRLDAGDPPRADAAVPRRVVVGAHHSCALMANDTLRCWGDNGWGQLGVVTMTPQEVAGVHSPEGIDDAVEVAVGYGTTCVRHRGGGMSCWGANHLGQVTQPGSESVTDPTRIRGMDDALAVSAGQNVTCAVLADGTARCWGEQTYQGLGDGSDRQKSGPVPPKGLPPVRDIEVGLFGCALALDRSLWCWGMNHEPTPAKVAEGVDAVAVDNLSGCFLRSGEVWCWGWNGEGQVGGEAVEEHAAPRRVPGIEGAADVAVGPDFACALAGDGGVSCWGARRGNAAGFEAAGCLRDNNPSGGGGAPVITRYCPAPEPVPGLPAAVQIDAGDHGACAVTGAEPPEVWCWGAKAPAKVL